MDWVPCFALQELLNEALPKQPYGAFRNPRQLTYEQLGKTAVHGRA